MIHLWFSACIQKIHVIWDTDWICCNLFFSSPCSTSKPPLGGTTKFWLILTVFGTIDWYSSVPLFNHLNMYTSRQRIQRMCPQASTPSVLLPPQPQTTQPTFRIFNMSKLKGLYGRVHKCLYSITNFQTWLFTKKLLITLTEYKGCFLIDAYWEHDYL